MLKKVLLVSVLLTLLASSPALAESATYYADEYTGSPTASGVPYLPSNMTAAHPSLPLGTVAEVCAPNGKCVNVTINDRCACGIDLSRAAADALGMLEAGRMEVSVTPVGAGTGDAPGATPAPAAPVDVGPAPAYLNNRDEDLIAPLPPAEYVLDEGAAYKADAYPEAYKEDAAKDYEDEVLDLYPYESSWRLFQ